LNRLRFLLPTFTAIRTFFNTLHRMAYPFLGTFARSLGVEVDVIAHLLANRALVGALVPFIFPFIEPRGRKFGMLLSLGLFLIGVGMVAFWPTYPTLAIALILGTVSKYLFDPSMQAFLGDRVPYQRRGLVLALTEMGWSLAFIVGVPVAGFLIARWGWLAPFPLFGILALLSMLLLAKALPPEQATWDTSTRLYANFRTVIASPVAWMGLGIGLFASAANEVVNLMFGVWLEDSFGLQLAALAGASAVIGISELGAEGLVAAFADRLGKPRAVALGLLANCAAALALPFLGRSPVGALIGLFLFYISFEFQLVSSIPLMTEVLPQARATLMAFNIAGISLGRAIGAFLAPMLYATNFSAVAFASIGLNFLALMAVWLLSRKMA
jgi:predicted MFS family arabinose efflux permease